MENYKINPVTEKLVTAKDDVTKIDYEDINDKSGYWIDDEPDSDMIVVKIDHNYIKDKLINFCFPSLVKKYHLR